MSQYSPPPIRAVLLEIFIYIFLNSDPNQTQTQILTLLTQTVILTLNKVNKKKCADKYFLLPFYSL